MYYFLFCPAARTTTACVGTERRDRGVMVKGRSDEIICIIIIKIIIFVIIMIIIDGLSQSQFSSVLMVVMSWTAPGLSRLFIWSLSEWVSSDQRSEKCRHNTISYQYTCCKSLDNAESVCFLHSFNPVGKLHFTIRSANNIFSPSSHNALAGSGLARMGRASLIT